MHRIPSEIEAYWTEIHGKDSFWHSSRYAIQGGETYRLLASTYQLYRKICFQPLVIDVTDVMDWVYRLEDDWYSETDMLRMLKLRAFL